MSSSDEVGRFYDRCGAVMQMLWGEYLHHGYWTDDVTDRESAGEAMVRLVGEGLALSGGMKVIDVGCGYGSTGMLLSQWFEVEVLGLTISSIQVRDALPGARVIQADWLENGLPAESYDGCIAIESLEHMGDLAKAVSEIERVLKPGGRAVIATWVEGEDISLMERWFLLELVQKSGRLSGQTSAAEIERVLETSGLRLRHRRAIGSKVSKSWAVCLRRALGMVLRKPVSLRALSLGEMLGFALAVPCVIFAYQTGALDYRVITAVKPGSR